MRPWVVNAPEEDDRDADDGAEDTCGLAEAMWGPVPESPPTWSAEAPGNTIVATTAARTSNSSLL